MPSTPNSALLAGVVGLGSWEGSGISVGLEGGGGDEGSRAPMALSSSCSSGWRVGVGLRGRSSGILGGRSGGGGGTFPLKRLIGGGAGSAAPRLVAAPPAGASVLPLARWAHWDPGMGDAKDFSGGF